jgi:hypothetical protein
VSTPSRLVGPDGLCVWHALSNNDLAGEHHLQGKMCFMQAYAAHHIVVHPHDGLHQAEDVVIGRSLARDHCRRIDVGCQATQTMQDVGVAVDRGVELIDEGASWRGTCTGHRHHRADT